MIEGNYNIDFVTDDMLDKTVFPERSETSLANNHWEKLNTTVPNFPKDSAIVYQAFGDQAPEWAHKIKEMFDWLEHKQVTINKLLPGNFIPPHTDEMFKLKQSLLDKNIDINNVELIRVTMFLTDHKLGHWINIDNQSLDNYNKGDYSFIRPGVLHTVANLGYQDRYTLQVTGTVK